MLICGIDRVRHLAVDLPLSCWELKGLRSSVAEMTSRVYIQHYVSIAEILFSPTPASACCCVYEAANREDTELDYFSRLDVSVRQWTT